MRSCTCCGLPCHPPACPLPFISCLPHTPARLPACPLPACRVASPRGRRGAQGRRQRPLPHLAGVERQALPCGTPLERGTCLPIALLQTNPHPHIACTRQFRALYSAVRCALCCRTHPTHLCCVALAARPPLPGRGAVRVSPAARQPHFPPKKTCLYGDHRVCLAICQ
jgi:hypothetical protein